MRQIRLRIDDENYARLLKAKEQKSSSINALINSALLELARGILFLVVISSKNSK